MWNVKQCWNTNRLVSKNLKPRIVQPLIATKVERNTNWLFEIKFSCGWRDILGLALPDSCWCPSHCQSRYWVGSFNSLLIQYWFHLPLISLLIQYWFHLPLIYFKYKSVDSLCDLDCTLSLCVCLIAMVVGSLFLFQEFSLILLHLPRQ